MVNPETSNNQTVADFNATAKDFVDKVLNDGYIQRELENQTPIQLYSLMDDRLLQLLIEPETDWVQLLIIICSMKAILVESGFQVEGVDPTE